MVAAALQHCCQLLSGASAGVAQLDHWCCAVGGQWMLWMRLRVKQGSAWWCSVVMVWGEGCVRDDAGAVVSVRCDCELAACWILGYVLSTDAHKARRMHHQLAH